MFIKFFDQISKSDVAIAGGKGASLGEMTLRLCSGRAQAECPVPPGFVILASAFEKFLEETDLNVEIDSILHSVNHKKIHTVENASEKIKALILEAKIPSDIASEIKKVFKKLNAKFVAVRSSATAEDSKTAAWAGQLESYLNTTEKHLLENVKKCWASLFTPRAIFYRFEKNLHKQKISVAVVVQKMVQGEVSGVVFSVHPVTQDRNQLIIEAVFGLGEALVLGQITPDSYVVEKKPRRILDKNVANQTKALQKSDKGSGWKEIKGAKSGKQKLSDKEIISLAKLIVRIENHYGFPVDVEWAKEKGKFYIVQSRPITTLQKQGIIKKEERIKDRYERVFGGPNMPFLVSDIVTDVYVYKHEFVAIKINDVWTCYIPLRKKKQALDKGNKLYSSKEAYRAFKADYAKFIDNYKQKFNLIFGKGKSITSEQFDQFVELCKSAEIHYSYTQYFYTDLITTSKKFESDFGALKEKGRALLNDQYFSKNNYLERILEKVSEKTGVDLGYLYLYTWREISDLLKNRDISVPGKSERSTFISYLDNSEKITLTGKKAKEKITKFLNNHKKQHLELTGTVANKGKAKGNVRILDQGYEHKNISVFVNAMKQGEILVAETTSPEIIAACKKAIAIITNQGGLMSHAAIVSRELNIPCIVGVEGATTTLKDGDLVEVDANRGVVKILEKRKG